ncbi:MAG: hypothetical protein M3442_22110 [Chloroflexota bacterium]|nr:hypothetical protein [Chloroflexota bacterium]
MTLRMTRRRFSRLGIGGAGTLALGATACGTAGGGTPGGTTPAPAAAGRPQGSLTIMSRADPYIYELFKEQVKAFTAENPGVQIEIDH